jgi:hypothetical protein
MNPAKGIPPHGGLLISNPGGSQAGSMLLIRGSDLAELVQREVSV